LQVLKRICLAMGIQHWMERFTDSQIEYHLYFVY
jgi:hypothetical protein